MTNQISSLSEVRVGSVRDASFCRAVDSVTVRHVSRSGEAKTVATDATGRWALPEGCADGVVTFEKEGFSSKSFQYSKTPPMVRLLEDRILGYQDKLGFAAGETVKVRVHSLRPYRARLFRHGIRKEEVLDLGVQSASPQTVPDRFFVETGPEWTTSFHYVVPPAARPGLYSLLLEETDHPEVRFAVAMAVTSAGRTENSLLVLASSNTWQSYNAWGGRSRYRNFETEETVALNRFSKRQRLLVYMERFVPPSLWKMMRRFKRSVAGSSDFPWMHDLLGLCRPFTNLDLLADSPEEPFTTHLADAEWRFLAWLEREGIPYDFVTGFELDRNPGMLRDYGALALVGHSEYWSRKMYEGLRDAHLNYRLSILNISGNSIFRQVEFTKKGDMRCVSLSFAESCGDETELIGVRFHQSDYGTCAPYKVIESGHLLFNDVDVQNGDLFGSKSLNRETVALHGNYQPGRPGSGDPRQKFSLTGEGASGWETDKMPSHRRDEFTLVAKGQNKLGGADMIFRDFDKTRGSVFSASSVTYTGALLIDETVSAITKNALHHVLRPVNANPHEAPKAVSSMPSAAQNNP